MRDEARTAAHEARSSSNGTVSAPSVSLPKGGGGVRGIGEKFAANPVTGTSSMSVPLATSPGRSGFGPQLSLTYDSGAGNGPFGFGWSLPIPSITRKTDKGLPRYQDTAESDVYILSGAEDLVPVMKPDGKRWSQRRVVSGVDYTIERYRPRIEGLFARIERWMSTSNGEIHWRSITRDNVTTLYGKDNNSRIFDPEDPSPLHPRQIFSWLICESYDDKGNAIVYQYAAENGDNVDRGQANERNRLRTANRYLKRIKYGNRVSRLIQTDLSAAKWMFEAVFDYDEAHYKEVDLDPARPEAQQHRFVGVSALTGYPWAVRPDPFSSHRAGFEMRTYRRCRRVLMFHHIPDLPTGEKGCDGLVRSIEFDYADLDYTQPVTIEDELAHQGSTRFASFIRRITQSGYVRDVTQPAVVENGVEYATYLKKSLPPLEFEYSKADIQDQVQEVDAASLENLPAGLDGSTYRWVDLYGEGITGILTEQASAWFYKRNLSPISKRPVEFAPSKCVASKPNLSIAGSQAQFMDLAGDGQPDLVVLDGPVPGLYEHDGKDGWRSFRPFTSRLNRDTRDPNLKFIDLTGDGRADVIVTEQDVFTWHPSRAEEGFDAAHGIHQALDEERGPRLVFDDGTQSIYLADMCGDGLIDIVRIRNGEVCYWPNLGYGRFGAKVMMDNAPWFDHPDQFNQQRIRLADIDGSGANDIIYLHRDGARIYFNQSGNQLTEPRRLDQFPLSDNVASVITADLLGNGTACLVWSSPLAGDARRPLRYIDLMGHIKPHLLVKSVNNLGAETEIHYAPSTRFYLEDERVGRSWLTRLPFPVHVVKRVVTHDRISSNRFVTHYAYHHGHFDGVEREFRGFGMVEQWDTEEFGALQSDSQPPVGTNIDGSSHVPPVLTKTWFHTGVYDKVEEVSQHLAAEYYGAPNESDPDYQAAFDAFFHALLPDTIIPANLTAEEEREACRALKGSMLRQEVYAQDGTSAAEHPYTVTEQNFTIRRLQPQGSNRHGVFFTHAREAVSYHYEREPADPRISHAMTLDVDDYGNVLKSAAICYGRRQPGVNLASTDRVERARIAEQSRISITYTENRVTNAVETDDDHRTPQPCEARTYQLTEVIEWQDNYPEALEKYFLPKGRERFIVAEILKAGTTGTTCNYEQPPAAGRLEKRLIQHVRTYYRHNDLTGDLGLGELQSLALPYQSYQLAFTPGLVSDVYGSRLFDTMLADEGRYVHTEGDTNWWIPSGQIFYSPNPSDDAVQELAFARQHFFLPCRFRDPFHIEALSTESFVTYDRYDLLIEETRDAIGNRITAGERDINWDRPLVRRAQDYRVLQPAMVMDPNRNRSAVAFDALGLVVGTAVMGKPLPAPAEGDSLVSFVTDLEQAQLDDFFDAADPHATAKVLLGGATTRIVYDLDRFQRTRRANPTVPEQWQPACAATLVRETHLNAPLPPQGLKIQLSFSYSDGFGREIQKKVQAEPGPVPRRDAAGKIIAGADGQPVMTPTDASQRWVGSGWTVFNNKGKPLRQYEPFFTDTHYFEFDVKIGVSSVLFYDPVERVVATLHPDHTWEKVVFDPWRQETWDVNDTVLIADPKTDVNVGGFFGRLSDADYLPTWHGLRTDASRATAFATHYPDVTDRTNEAKAAEKTVTHAATPSIMHADPLGRTFLTVAHNKAKYSDTPAAAPPVEEFHATRIVFDIEGNQREVIDAKDRVVMRYAYDMLGNRIHQASMEAGERWMLNDVAGKPLCVWDSRDHRFRTTYDRLQRPTSALLSESGGAEMMIEQTLYGESRPDPEDGNLRGKVVKLSDQAGVVIRDDYDFKGNLLSSQWQLARAVDRQGARIPAYKTTVDWSRTVQLESEAYTSRTCYDALNRPTQLIAPHSDRSSARVNVIQLGYNEANFLEKVDAWLNEAAEPDKLLIAATANLHAVTNIDYDAKGQRLRIAYGNGARTSYTYDPLTFRLRHLYTRRGASFTADCENPDAPPPTIAAPEPPPRGKPCGVQNLHYTYDPVGNITHIRDNAQQMIYFKNVIVEPHNEYTYDAIYRLIEATGREHLGQAGGSPIPHSHNDARRVGMQSSPLDGRFHPHDGNAMGRYCECYDYDAVGNIMEMIHRVACPGSVSWRRGYSYKEKSQLEPAKHSNRLTSTTIGSMTETYGYDPHGNMLDLPHLTLVQWDSRDQLQATAQQAVTSGGTPETTYYVYDASGQRVRKVTERQVPANETPIRMKERIYLGGFEIYREYENDGETKTLERETLHLMDDKQRIAIVETRTFPVTPNPSDPLQLIRYQYGNHLSSTSLELDERAGIISYEEYSPYGSSTYQAVRSRAKAAKRYRYTGKERDEESGLYFNEARYYASQLGRWIGCDPAGLIDGPNLFRYAKNNPVVLKDPNGYAPLNPENFATFQSYLDASPKVYTQTYLQQTWESAHGPMAPAAPRSVSYRVARMEASTEATSFRLQEGMVGTGPVVQAGHTIAARHVPESGISRAAANASKTFMPLTSRHGFGMSVDVSGHPTPLTPHRAQELVIDASVEKARARSGGVLTPEAHQASGAEVRWRLQGTGFDQREADLKRAGGFFDEAAAIEKNAAVQAHRSAKSTSAAASTLGNVKAALKPVAVTFAISAFFAAQDARAEENAGDSTGKLLAWTQVAPGEVGEVGSVIYQSYKMLRAAADVAAAWEKGGYIQRGYNSPSELISGSIPDADKSPPPSSSSSRFMFQILTGFQSPW